MLQQRAREAAGYDLPNSSDEDEEPYEEPVEAKTRKRTVGKEPGWEVIWNYLLELSSIYLIQYTTNPLSTNGNFLCPGRIHFDFCSLRIGVGL